MLALISEMLFVSGDNGEHTLLERIDVCVGYNSVLAIRSIFNCVEK